MENSICFVFFIFESFPKHYVNIGLFGTYFNMILDKIGFLETQFWEYHVTISLG